MSFQWSKDQEAECLRLKGRGLTNTSIAKHFGTSANSVKHKVRRLQQSSNDDRYKHTEEKEGQARKLISGRVFQFLRCTAHTVG